MLSYLILEDSWVGNVGEKVVNKYNKNVLHYKMSYISNTNTIHNLLYS